MKKQKKKRKATPPHSIISELTNTLVMKEIEKKLIGAPAKPKKTNPQLFDPTILD